MYRRKSCLSTNLNASTAERKRANYAGWVIFPRPFVRGAVRRVRKSNFRCSVDRAPEATHAGAARLHIPAPEARAASPVRTARALDTQTPSRCKANILLDFIKLYFTIPCKIIVGKSPDGEVRSGDGPNRRKVRTAYRPETTQREWSEKWQRDGESSAYSSVQ